MVSKRHTGDGKEKKNKNKLSRCLCEGLQDIYGLSNTIIKCIHSFLMYPFKYDGIMYCGSYRIDMGAVSKDMHFN